MGCVGRYTRSSTYSSKTRVLGTRTLVLWICVIVLTVFMMKCYRRIHTGIYYALRRIAGLRRTVWSGQFGRTWFVCLQENMKHVLSHTATATATAERAAVLITLSIFLENMQIYY